MRYRFEDEAGTLVDSPSTNEVDNLISKLDGNSNSFASLECLNGNYVQAGGGPSRFVLEIRIIDANGEFSHYRAATSAEVGGTQQLTVGGASVSVSQNEIVGLSTVQEVFRSFLGGDFLPSIVAWRNITAMFY
jgi:hypothetical protein